MGFIWNPQHQVNNNSRNRCYVKYKETVMVSKSIIVAGIGVGGAVLVGVLNLLGAEPTTAIDERTDDGTDIEVHGDVHVEGGSGQTAFFIKNEAPPITAEAKIISRTASTIGEKNTFQTIVRVEASALPPKASFAITHPSLISVSLSPFPLGGIKVGRTKAVAVDGVASVRFNPPVPSSTYDLTIITGNDWGRLKVVGNFGGNDT